jgi:hypothetical protein
VTRESVVTNVGRGGNERFSKIIGIHLGCHRAEPVCPRLIR